MQKRAYFWKISTKKSKINCEIKKVFSSLSENELLYRKENHSRMDIKKIGRYFPHSLINSLLNTKPPMTIFLLKSLFFFPPVFKRRNNDATNEYFRFHKYKQQEWLRRFF